MSNVGRPFAAYAAFAWMAFFAVVHIYWLVGGTVGLPPGKKLTDSAGLLIADIIAIPLCMVGAALALALTQTGRARPSPRTLQRLAVATAVVSVVHAGPAMISWVLRPLGVEDGELTDEERFSLFLYEPFWLLGGILFGLATWEYRRALHRSESDDRRARTNDRPAERPRRNQRKE